MSNEAPPVDPELDELLWSMAGAQFTGLDPGSVAEISQQPEIREQLYGQATMALAMAREQDLSTQLTDTTHPRFFGKVLEAVLGGRPPSSVVPKSLNGETGESPTDEDLVIRTARYLRVLGKVLELPPAISPKEPETQEPSKEVTPDLSTAEESPDETNPKHKIEELAKIVSETGDPHATTMLLTMINPFVVRYCRARIGPGGGTVSADDIAQDVILAAFDNLQTYQYQEGRSFMAYIYTIAHHKVVDYYRAITRNRTDAYETIPETPSLAASDNPETSYLHLVEREQVEALLGILPPIQRDILILRVVVGLSAEETAQIVGAASPGAVRVSQHRALRSLRQQVAALGIMSGDDLPATFVTALNDMMTQDAA